MPVHRRVSCGRAVWRGVDQADHAPLGYFLGCDIRPGLSSVASEVNQPVVGAGPDEVFLHRRLSHGKDHVVVFNPGILLGDGAAGHGLLGLVVAREVWADGGPTHPAVGAFKQNLCRVIEHVGIVWREQDGRGPLEAVL